MDTQPTKQQPFVSYADMKIDKRNTPATLCYALKGLTDAQNADIKDMGFESVKLFNIHNIPAGLGYSLLVNYDHNRNELKVGNRVVKITPLKVHEVLGVPMGKIAITETRKKAKKDAFREEWRSQFSYATVTVKQVVEKLKSYRDGGMLFKLNFLVVFNSIMGETTKSATVNQKFLTAISNEGDIPNMDWCSYIVTCLKRTKAGWDGIEPYNGPLTFLAVLYAHEQRVKRSPENVVIPALQYVTTDFLVDLESSMYYEGSCMNDNIEDVKPLTQNVEDAAQSLGTEAQAELETPSDEARNDKIQTQTDEGQTTVDQNVSMPDVTSVPTNSALNPTLPIPPQGANSGHCDRVGPSKIVLNVDTEVDSDLTQYVEAQVQLIASVVQVQSIGPEVQTATDQSVNVPQDEEDRDQIQSTERHVTSVQIDSLLNLKLPTGPPGAQSLAGLSASLGHCNRLAPPKDKKLPDDDDDDVIILSPKQEQGELVERFPSRRRSTVCVQGYTVNKDVAKILEAILNKHGDIAAKCLLKTDNWRSSILEGVCEVAKRIQANDIEKLEEMECRLSDAKAVHIDVSWLQAHIEAIRERKEANEEYKMLMEMKANTSLAKKAAEISLRKRRAELAITEEESKKAKRCARVVHLVGQNLTNSFFESIG